MKETILGVSPEYSGKNDIKIGEKVKLYETEMGCPVQGRLANINYSSEYPYLVYINESGTIAIGGKKIERC